jgi:hypothetical protein
MIRRSARSVRYAPPMRAEDLASVERGEVGYYLPDRYFMGVNKSLEGNPDPIVTVHEYWHYLQNTSTFHGIRSFAAIQQLVSVFSHSLSADGTSAGSDSLDDELKDRARRFLRFRAVEDGEGIDSKGGVVSEVTSIEGSRVRFDVRPERGGPGAMREYAIGALAIKESIAHLVERQLADLVGLPRPRAPEFPYSILDRVVSYTTQQVVPDLVVAAIGTYSLLTPAPFRATLDLATQYRQRVEAGASPVEAVQAAGDEIAVPNLRAGMPLVRDSLQSICSIHQGRGMLEKAAKLIAAESTRAMERRCEDPLFDLRPLLEGEEGSITKLTALMSEFPPCPMAFGDAILTFRPLSQDEQGFDDVQYLMALHSQVHFALMHVASQGFLPSSHLKKACPFVRTCEHPNHSLHGENCRVTPWKNYVDAKHGCWFSEGVAASIGLKGVAKATDP